MLSRACLLCLFTLSVFAQDVKVNWDKSAFFSNYKTYAWITLPGVNATHPLMAEEIMAQTDGQLAAKSLKKAKVDEADLLVAYQTSVANAPPPPAADESSPYQPGASWNGKQSESLPTGTLAVNLYDAKTKALVWRALVTAQVGESRPSDKMKVAKGLSKAFAKYPPMGK